MNLSLLTVLLANDVSDCSYRPPLLPTQCAILRALYLLGTCRLQRLLRIVPCHRVTLIQQLSRLTAVGLVERKRDPSGSDYSLSVNGRRMVQQWQVAVTAAIGAIAKECGALQGVAKELQESAKNER